MSEKTKYKVEDWLSFADVPTRSVEVEADSRDEAIIEYIKVYYPDVDLDKKSEVGGIKMGLVVSYLSGPKDETKTTRCTNCATEFTDIETEGATACPECGNKGVPMDIKNDVSAKINWHELRILTIWAENWARQCDKDEEKEDDGQKGMLYTIMCIAQRLQDQFPNKTALTLFSEVRNLRKNYEIESDADDDSLLNL